MSIYTDALSAFTERFADVLDEGGTLTGDAPTYWQDDVAELADSLVPVYTTERVREWLDDGCPDVDDTCLIEGVTDVSQIIAVALYERYSQELYTLADRAGFND